MKIKLRILLTGASLTTFFFAGVLLALILYPQNLFAKRVDHRNLRIYTDRALHREYKRIFDDALALARRSELYEEHLTFDVFLAHKSFYNALDTRVFGRALARSVDNNVILKVEVDFKNNLLVGPSNTRNLIKTIAHEIIHCLQLEKYGILKFNPLSPPEVWIREGYPEYMVNSLEQGRTVDRLKSQVTRLLDYQKSGALWVEITPGQFDPLSYFKGQVLIGFLMDINEMTYDEIINGNLNEADTYDQMMKWYAQQQIPESKSL